MRFDFKMIVCSIVFFLLRVVNRKGYDTRFWAVCQICGFAPSHAEKCKSDETRKIHDKSAENIDFLLGLLYNYAVFLYLPESEGKKWI